MPFLHEHRRRVPTQDYTCRISVSVVRVAAYTADKRRLVLAALAVNGPAFRAGLRRIGSGDFAQTSPALFKFVIE